MDVNIRVWSLLPPGVPAPSGSPLAFALSRRERGQRECAAGITVTTGIM